MNRAWLCRRHFRNTLTWRNMHLPVTERISTREGLWLDEEIFREGEAAVDEVVAALKKVKAALADDPSLADRIRALD